MLWLFVLLRLKVAGLLLIPLVYIYTPDQNELGVFYCSGFYLEMHWEKYSAFLKL